MCPLYSCVSIVLISAQCTHVNLGHCVCPVYSYVSIVLIRAQCTHVHMLVLYACRVVENGVETVTVEEDGVLKQHLVNGESMMITN